MFRINRSIVAFKENELGEIEGVTEMICTEPENHPSFEKMRDTHDEDAMWWCQIHDGFSFAGLASVTDYDLNPQRITRSSSAESYDGHVIQFDDVTCIHSVTRDRGSLYCQND